MNVREFQRTMCEDLEALFAGTYYKTPNHTMGEIKAYEQNIPPRDAQAEDTEDPFPYIEVRIQGGEIKTPTDPHRVEVFLLIGIFDDSTGNSRNPPPPPSEDGSPVWDTRNLGTTALLEIIERIQAHYEKRPSLENGAFYLDDSFSWALQSEGSYPYYYGYCDMVFTLAAPRKERSKFV